jgi:dTDP-4-dehydrorhamnose 3,5-epimerase
MIFRETALKGAFLIELQPHVDDRGQFARAWCAEEFRRAGIDVEIAQGARPALERPARGGAVAPAAGVSFVTAYLVSRHCPTSS